MLNKKISRNIAFTLILFIFSLSLISCSRLSAKTSSSADKKAKGAAAEYKNPEIVGTISSNEIVESSGLVNSRCQTDVFWTHNDSGDGAFVYALNEKGEKLGTWKVSNAQNRDWEDIATFKDTTGKCFLYLGDIGNNDLDKNQLAIYKFVEPTVTASEKNTNKQNPAVTEPAEAINFSYPDGNHNAETLMVHPNTGEIYVISKEPNNPASVYKVGEKTEKISDLTVPAVPYGLLTGGEISPDGKRVVVCDYIAGYELKLPDSTANFDDIWKQTPLKIELGERKQGESIAYSAAGDKIYAGSEKKNSPIIRVEHK